MRTPTWHIIARVYLLYLSAAVCRAMEESSWRLAGMCRCIAVGQRERERVELDEGPTGALHLCGDLGSDNDGRGMDGMVLLGFLNFESDARFCFPVCTYVRPGAAQ
jgi:hypothetical protein